MSAEIAPSERGFVVQAARRMHNDVVHAKERLNHGAFMFGGALARMQDEKAYTALGFATFENYLAGPEVAIHRTTAYRFIRVFRTYGHVAHGLRGSYDIQKLDILGRLIDEDTDPEQIEALVEEAREIPREVLRAKVEAVRAERATPRAVPVPPPTPLETPLVAQRRAAGEAFTGGLAALWEAQATDPKYVAREQCRVFGQIDSALSRIRELGIRELVASTSPAEMAHALLDAKARDGIRYGSGAKWYERDVKPILDWYAGVGELLNAPPATIRRVK